VPVVVRVRCPGCRSTLTYVYRTVDAVQYRACRQCGFAFKAIREPADPTGSG